MPPRKAATARERARAELTREIKEEARRQLARTGADGLSLRAVARELGMVSSALYRYYPSRDDLLTALIIDAYNALGEAAEGAIAPAGDAGVAGGAGGPGGAGPAGGTAGARWVAVCHAIRDWARSHPQEYALIYGSPVPGYRAPEATIGPAARVPLAFLGLLAAAAAGGEITAVADTVPVAGVLAEQAAALSAALAPPAGAGGPASVVSAASPSAASRQEGACATSAAAAAAAASREEGERAGVPPDMLVRAVIAWTQLFGMISFELFGQFVGSFEPADALFAHAAAQLAAFVGLR